MKKIMDVGFGRETLYDLYSTTQISSKWLYGMAQLSTNYKIEHAS